MAHPPLLYDPPAAFQPHPSRRLREVPQESPRPPIHRLHDLLSIEPRQQHQRPSLRVLLSRSLVHARALVQRLVLFLALRLSRLCRPPPRSSPKTQRAPTHRWIQKDQHSQRMGPQRRRTRTRLRRAPARHPRRRAPHHPVAAEPHSSYAEGSCVPAPRSRRRNMPTRTWRSTDQPPARPPRQQMRKAAQPEDEAQRQASRKKPCRSGRGESCSRRQRPPCKSRCPRSARTAGSSANTSPRQSNAPWKRTSLGDTRCRTTPCSTAPATGSPAPNPRDATDPAGTTLPKISENAQRAPSASDRSDAAPDDSVCHTAHKPPPQASPPGAAARAAGRQTADAGDTTRATRPGGR